LSLEGFLTSAAVFLGGVAALLNCVQGVLRPSESQELRRAFEASYVRVDDAQPMSVVRAPLRWARTLLDSVLGGGLVTKRALRRSSIASWLILLVCLSASGWKSGHSLGFEEWPWRAIDTAIERAHRHAETVVRTQTSATDEDRILREEANAELIQELKALDRFRSSGWKFAYTCFVFMGLLATSASLSFVVLVLTRHYLRGIETDPSGLVLLGSLAVHSTLVAMAATVGLFAFAVITSPFVLCGVLLAIGSSMPSEWMALGLLLVAGGAWFVGGVTIKTAATAAMWPALLGLVAVFLAVALYPIHRFVHRGIGHLLLRVAEHPSGPLSPIVVVLSVLTALAAYVARFPNWSLMGAGVSPTPLKLRGRHALRMLT